MKLISFLVALALCLFAAAGCSGGETYIKLTFSDGAFTDAQSGVVYINAPMYYEPVSVDPEVYAVCKEPSVELHKIIGLDEQHWLSETFDGVGNVYYNANEVSLPDALSDFGAVSVVICVEDVITSGIAHVSDTETVNAAVKAFSEGDSVPLTMKGDSYELKFVSDKYEGLYYSLIYIDGDSGENYIYDRLTKRCVPVGDVLAAYISGTAS